jgi:PAS domain S-box-containing protein
MPNAVAVQYPPASQVFKMIRFANEANPAKGLGMRHSFDRGTLLGIALLSLMMVGIAATSYLNTQRLGQNADSVAHSREIVELINTVQYDTVKMQADVRVYFVTGFPESLKPYQDSSIKLRADAKQLAALTANDPDHPPHVESILKEIETGIANYDAVVKLRGEPGGHDAVVRMSRERGLRSFGEPLLTTLKEMETIERSRLDQLEANARAAYQRAIIYGITAAALGLTAVALFIWLFAKSTKARQLDSERLAAQRELLSSTLSSIGDAVISTDEKGIVTFLNPIAEKLTGWPTSEAIGTPLEQVFHIVNETTRLPVDNPAFRALEEGAIVGLANHTVLIAKDGVERPIDDSAAPIKSQGKITGAVLVFRDMTEKKLAQELLRQSEEQRRLALDGAELGVWHLDPEGNELITDQRFRAIFGCKADSISFDEAVAVIHPEDQQLVQDAVQAATRPVDPLPYAIEYRVVHPDGSIHWVFAKGSPTYDKSNKLKSFDGTVAEVTERYQTQVDAARLAAIVECSEDAIVSKSLDGIIQTWNAGAERLFGYTAAEAIGQPIAMVIPDDRMNEEQNIIARLRKGERIEHFDTIRMAKGGRLIELSITVSPIRNTKGIVIGASKIARDISERIAIEQALKETDRQKDNFIALLAHELRNPLAPIRNGLQVVKLSQDPAKREKAREMMERQLGHMVRLIDDLLDISRISRNKMELRLEPVSLAEIISIAVETSRPGIDETKHTLNVTLPDEPLMLHADKTRLAQVFSNLLTNSAKYTPAGGSISLSAEHRAGEVVVTVRDNGIGIPPEAIHHIFDMFSQVDRSINRTTGGLGIGLALVKGLVEMHHGTVVAQSPGENKGSTFQVTLPIIQSSPAVAQKVIEEPTHQEYRRKVLVVDDNIDGAESLALMLELLGNTVEKAHNGIDAVERAETFRPEIIFMDVGMPKLNGLDATIQIREKDFGHDIKIYALTGWGQDSDRQRSNDAGCTGHLVKPVSLTELKKLLE